MEAPDPTIEIFNTSGLEIPVTEFEAAFLLKVISEGEECEFSFVEVVFVDEKEIVRINKEFLDRDYITDIISFRYDDNHTNLEIEGTLYCCAQRIAEQAEEYSDSVKEEILRIITHGLIHLVGYDDQSPEEKAEMTRLENKYLKELADQ
jgi:rRNA maturation RNase YbeY